MYSETSKNGTLTFPQFSPAYGGCPLMAVEIPIYFVLIYKEKFCMYNSKYQFIFKVQKNLSTAVCRSFSYFCLIKRFRLDGILKLWRIEIQ